MPVAEAQLSVRAPPRHARRDKPDPGCVPIVPAPANTDNRGTRAMEPWPFPRRRQHAADVGRSPRGTSPGARPAIEECLAVWEPPEMTAGSKKPTHPRAHHCGARRRRAGERRLTSERGTPNRGSRLPVLLKLPDVRVAATRARRARRRDRHEPPQCPRARGRRIAPGILHDGERPATTHGRPHAAESAPAAHRHDDHAGTMSDTNGSWRPPWRQASVPYPVTPRASGSSCRSRQTQPARWFAMSDRPAALERREAQTDQQGRTDGDRVPKPAAPSMKAPNENATSNACTRRSFDKRRPRLDDFELPGVDCQIIEKDGVRCPAYGRKP